MHLSSYLFFNGNCAEALAFYQKAVGAEVKATMTYGTSPAASHLPPAMHDKIIHADFRIGDTVLMASDCPPDKWGGAPTGFSLCIGVQSNEEAERLYAALSDGGKVCMAIGETFFAHRFGQFTDKFGVPWMIIHGKNPG